MDYFWNRIDIMSSTSQLLLTGKPLDLIPNAFGFTDVTGAVVSTITTSDTITPIGYDSQTTWSINNGDTASVAGGAAGGPTSRGQDGGGFSGGGVGILGQGASGLAYEPYAGTGTYNSQG